MVCSSAGDYGDLIFLLGVMHSIPSGPHTLLLKTSPLTKIRTDADLKRFADMVIPLAKSQPYISDCRIRQANERVDWRSQDFRGKGRWCPEVTLLGAKSYHLQTCLGFGQNIHGTNRWLHNIVSSPLSKDRVVINRTGRYRNPYFPWREVIDFYGDRLLFIGVPHEYRDFCGQFGCIEWAKTSNMLEVAELIAGSLLFIGNQSSPNAVAEGLKHPMIQETDLGTPDCIFKRPNAQHVGNGSVMLLGFDGETDRHIPCTIRPSVNTSQIPPNGWEYPNAIPSKILRTLTESVARMESVDFKAAESRIVAYNVERKPGFFRSGSSDPALATFNLALKNAV